MDWPFQRASGMSSRYTAKVDRRLACLVVNDAAEAADTPVVHATALRLGFPSRNAELHCVPMKE